MPTLTCNSLLCSGSQISYEGSFHHSYLLLHSQDMSAITVDPIVSESDDRNTFKVVVKDAMSVGKDWVSSDCYVFSSANFHLSCNCSKGVYCFNLFFDNHLDECPSKNLSLGSRFEVHGPSGMIVFNGFMSYQEKTEQIRFTLPQDQLKPYVTENGDLDIILQCTRASQMLLLEGMNKTFKHETTSWTLDGFDQLDSKGQTSPVIKDCNGNSYTVWCFKSTASRFCLEIYATEDKKPMPIVKKDSPMWFRLSIGKDDDNKITMEARRLFKNKRSDAIRFAYDWNRIKALVSEQKVQISIQFGTFPDHLQPEGCGRLDNQK